MESRWKKASAEGTLAFVYLLWKAKGVREGGIWIINPSRNLERYQSSNFILLSVLVEPSAGLDSQVSCFRVFDEEGAGVVFGPEGLFENFHYR